MEWDVVLDYPDVELLRFNVADAIDVRAVQNGALAGEVEELVEGVSLQQVVELEPLFVRECG